VHAGEVVVDDLPGAIVGRGEQVRVDAQGEGRVGVADLGVNLFLTVKRNAV
jgi:hypothetical protein